MMNMFYHKERMFKLNFFFPVMNYQEHFTRMVFRRDRKLPPKAKFTVPRATLSSWESGGAAIRIWMATCFCPGMSTARVEEQSRIAAETALANAKQSIESNTPLLAAAQSEAQAITTQLAETKTKLDKQPAEIAKLVAQLKQVL